MTHLRKMMLEELERRNYAQTTRDCYIQTIEDFARYFKRPPDQLGPEHIREYQAYLFRERKLAAHTVTQRLRERPGCGPSGRRSIHRGQALCGPYNLDDDKQCEVKLIWPRW